MSYYFIENKYPDSDTNIDLNFDNDILYTEVVDKDLDKNNVRYENGNVKALKNKKKSVQNVKETDTSESSDSVYLLFIIIVIMIIVLWYVYSRRNKTQKTELIDTYANSPDLVLLSPYNGMNR